LYKKLLKLKLVAALCLSLTACNNYKTIDGVRYNTFGLVNLTIVASPDIEYEISIGSAIFALLFFETVIVPIYILGWDIMQPVGKKSSNVYRHTE
jgi:hypothetical protein